MPFYLQSVHSGKYLDVEGANSDRGTRVITFDFNGDANQQWSYRSNGTIVSKMNGCVIYKRLNISVSFPIPFFLT